MLLHMLGHVCYASEKEEARGREEEQVNTSMKH